MCNDASVSSEEIPNHMIVWIDLNMGRPEAYQHIKAAFSSTTDPNYVNPIQLFDRNDEEINRAMAYKQVEFEDVKFLLAAFTNVERCVKFLQQNKSKKIFLITSGDIGRVLLPLIKEKCEEILIDPVTREPCQSIYVYCHSIERNMDWMIDYCAYLAPPFIFDADLLVRMIRDIADYFVLEGKRLLEATSPNYPAAFSRFSWAYTLYDRYRTLENNPLQEEFNTVNTLLETVEKAIKSSNDND